MELALTRITILAGLVAAAVSVGAAKAQINQPVPGPYGAEDGYNDDGFGWGPAYRPETNFRPSYGFYGGVERPYPYARYPQASAAGSLGQGIDHGIVRAPRRLRRPARHAKLPAHHRSAAHQARRTRAAE